MSSTGSTAAAASVTAAGSGSGGSGRTGSSAHAPTCPSVMTRMIPLIRHPVPHISPPLQSANCLSNGFLARLAGPNSDDLGQTQHEDFPIADPAGLGTFRDRVNGPLDELFVHGDLKLHLAQQPGFLMTPVHFGDALLPAAAHHARHRHQMNVVLGQLTQYLVKPVGLNDRDDILHS